MTSPPSDTEHIGLFGHGVSAYRNNGLALDIRLALCPLAPDDSTTTVGEPVTHVSPMFKPEGFGGRAPGNYQWTLSKTCWASAPRATESLGPANPELCGRQKPVEGGANQALAGLETLGLRITSNMSKTVRSLLLACLLSRTCLSHQSSCLYHLYLSATQSLFFVVRSSQPQ
jgi:hypothetical protein